MSDGASRPTRPVGLVVEQLRRSVPGGIGTYAVGLARALSELQGCGGPAVELLASRAPSGEDPVARLGLPLRSLPVPSAVLSRAWAAGALRPRGYRLVHAASLDVPAARCPVVVAVHDVLWRTLPQAYGRHGRAWHEAALRRALRRAEAFVVPTQEVADALAEGRRSLGRVAIIEYGADHLPAPDFPAAAALLANLGVGEDFLLSLGTLEPRKNLPRLFTAYAAVRERLTGRPPLVVCGPSGWGGEAVGAPRPPEGAVLAGFVDAPALSALLARARALLYVPLAEGFGLPVVEAMAAGTPVVASPVAASGGAALEVDPRDVAAIADAIVRVAEDPVLREQLVAAGRRRASGLTWRRIAAEHVALWDAVAPR